MRVKITADSTCDLPRDISEKYGIRILPLHIIKGSEDLLDGIEITPNDIFRYVEATDDMCKTAAVSVGEYEKAFREELRDCEAVIHINISSEFSACHQNACIAAAEVGGVYPIDSRNLSSGSGHLAIDAAIMAADGMTAEEISKKLKEDTSKLEVSFVLNTLRYLHLGGRCSGVAALGANLLQLRPCIEVRDGKMGVGKKYRGNMEKCLKQYITDRLAERDDIDMKRIFITHSGVDPRLLEQLKNLITQLASFEEVIESEAGCTISNHCGPQCLGILFYTV
ncbi:MAG: DegV family protein [Clostridiales bacterium]|nr:DegV family protein [Clostridiales bacterium]